MKIVAYSGNRNVYKAIACSILSLVEYNDIDKIYVIAEDKDIGYELPDNVEVLDYSEKHKKYFKEGGANYHCGWSYFTLMRVAYPLIFKDYDKILSLDCDTLIQGDISALWDIDITDYYLCASKEPLKSKKVAPNIYVNVGVNLMNLKLMRQDKIAEECIKRLHYKYYDFPDQDVQSEVCRGKILDMDARYNPTQWTALPDEQLIKHFAGQKDYIKNKDYKKYLGLL